MARPPLARRLLLWPQHNSGTAVAETIRTVVSLILRLAVQHEAIPVNPVRHLDPIEGGSRKPRALTAEERRRFLGWMQGTSADKEEARALARAGGIGPGRPVGAPGAVLVTSTRTDLYGLCALLRAARGRCSCSTPSAWPASARRSRSTR